MLVFHHYVGLPLPELADRLGIPLGTAKSRLHHATAALRASLDADARTFTAPRSDSHDRAARSRSADRAFFEDGTDVLPDWAYDEVRHDIHRTRQRTVIGPWREPVMSNLVKYGVIAAAVVLFVGAGAYLLRPSLPAIVGTPSPTPASSPTPVPERRRSRARSSSGTAPGR